MITKKVEFGTRVNVEVLDATPKLITVVDKVSNEGYLLAFHNIKDLPQKGDNGYIVFEKSSSPMGGHWQYYSNKK